MSFRCRKVRFKSVERRVKSFSREKTNRTKKKTFRLANDLSIPTNRYLSSCHCVFEFDQGRIYLRDTSSNGTLINRQKKLNKTDAVKETFCFDVERKKKVF
jgi:hypothetical protein